MTKLLQKATFASLFVSLTLAAALSLTACGEGATIEQGDVPQLVQHMFVLPDRITGQPYNYGAVPVTTVYLDTNETVKLWAAYSIDNMYLTSDNAEAHYISHSWTIDDETYNISPLRYSFATPGFHRGILKTVDLLGDTLQDTLNIFVNTPISIRAIAPVDGYNLFDPTPGSELDLQWELAGVDPWETARCFVFASFNVEEVWSENIGEVDCFHEAQFIGSFLTKNLFDNIAAGVKPDTSITVYWGIKASLTTSQGFIERDSSKVSRFSTRYIYTKNSRIDIPIVYEDLHKSDVHTVVTITSAQGDTLSIVESSKAPVTLHAYVTAQTGIRINLRDTKKTEFRTGDITLNVQSGTQIQLDTVRFSDKIQPQVAQLAPRHNQRDTVIFYALDNGSGINPKRIFVTANADTLEHTYEEPFIKFRNTCASTCKLRISVEDNARNSNPRLYWKLEPDANSAEGPFSEMGGEP